MLPSLFLPGATASDRTTSIAIGATVASAALAASLWLRYLHQKHPLDDLPGPPPSSFILGNAVETKGSIDAWHTTGQYPEPYLSWMTQYGGVVHFRELSTHFVMVSDPKALQHILVANGPNYPRHALLRSFMADRLLGVGLLSSTGTQHDQQRKMLNPHFTQAKLKHFVPLFERMAQRTCDSVLANATTALDLHAVFGELTLGAIGQTMFGFDFHGHPHARAAYERMMEPQPLWITLGLLFVPKFSFFPIPQLWAVQRAQQELRQIVLDIIAHKQAESLPAAHDLLDLMLPDTTPDDALVHVMTFMAAGHDTSSAGLSWVFIALATRPVVVATMRAEVKRVAALFDGSIGSWEAVSELKYTTAVIQETLRLWTVAPTIMRRVAVQDDSLPLSDGTTVWIPKDTAIEINPGAMHQNPRYWANANAFVPERFVEGTPEWIADEALRGTKHHTFVYMPFAFGAGNCIGQKFALAEMIVVTATLIREFDFALAPDADVRPIYAMPIINPVKLHMTVQRATE
ncbi:Aste57867_7521 [Aphanomyces stellatus]|uniref:Aste57867_7521 protein n=1 Tax=Aphanomyces stellatus TaxID=120398 RepID=A0A485KIG5_9STRA|nr:hypothetical protein As57867_007495 [Aphanomyces stellatus]VFT84430.1 Aste57867_7521 [Aphanomyces stellatus]